MSVNFEVKERDELIVRLRERIAELEAQLDRSIRTAKLHTETSMTAHTRYFELSSKYTEAVKRIAELEGHSNALIEFLRDVQPSCCCGTEEKERLMAKHKELIGGDA